MNLEEKQGDLYEIEESKKAIKELILTKLKTHSEYAGLSEDEAAACIDDFLGDAFDTVDLKQEIDDLEQAQDVQGREEMNRDYERSVF